MQNDIVDASSEIYDHIFIGFPVAICASFYVAISGLKPGMTYDDTF